MQLKIFGKSLFELNLNKKGFDSDFRRMIDRQMDGYSTMSYSISEKNAYEKHVWVYSCINKISRNIARTKLRFYNEKSNEEVTDKRLNDLFYNGKRNYFELVEGITNYLFSNGNAFLKLDNESGILAGFDLLDSDTVEAVKQGKNNLIGWRDSSEGYSVTYAPEQICQFKSFNPYDKFMGLSPVKVILLTIKQNQKARRFNDAILDNGTSIGLFFQTDQKMNDTEFERFKKEIKESGSGPANAGKPFVLDAGMKVSDLKLTSQDMAFIAQNKLYRDEIIAAFNIPPSLLGITEAVNRSNSESSIVVFWNETLIPVQQYICSVIDHKILMNNFPGIVSRFDNSQIYELGEDQEKKSNVAVKYTAIGFTANEVNEKLGLGFEDKPWRDTWYKPMGLSDVNNPDTNELLPETEKPEEDPLKRLQKSLENMSGKSVKSEKELRREFVWKKFDTEIRPVENKYARKVSRFMFEIRKEIIETLLNNHSELSFNPSKKALIDWISQKEKIAKISRPFFEQAILLGGQGGLDDLRIEDIVWNVKNRPAMDYLLVKENKIKGIVDTIEKRVNQRIIDGFSNGDTIAEVADSIRSIFNTVDSSAMRIAQTEIIGAANMGRNLAFQEAGITKKEWIDSNDGDVRDTHRLNMEVVGMNENFSNGLSMPHDPNGAPEEVINCRCLLGGVV